MLQTFSGRRASQDAGELGAFVALLLERGVHSYLEIGARHGDTFHHVMTSLPKGSRGVAVDLPGGLWGTDKSRNHLTKVVADLRSRGYDAQLMFGDSQTAGTEKMIFNRGPYDAALIDGDHSYAGVSRDWALYRKVAPIVAFHDIVGHDQVEKVHGKPVEVPRLWAEIKASGMRTLEFVSPRSKMGIGVCLTT